MQTVSELIMDYSNLFKIHGKNLSVAYEYRTEYPNRQTFGSESVVYPYNETDIRERVENMVSSYEKLCVEDSISVESTFTNCYADNRYMFQSFMYAIAQNSSLFFQGFEHKQEKSSAKSNLKSLCQSIEYKQVSIRNL